MKSGSTAFAILGVVRVLEERLQEPGIHELTWDGRDDGGHLVASGVYMTTLRTEDGPVSRQVVWTR